MKYFFIMNPTAGRKRKREFYPHLKKLLERSKKDEVFRLDTVRPGDATRFTKEIAEKYGRDAVLVSCGGDGTLHEVVNGLIGTEAAFALFPFGTGNDFAKYLYGRHWTMEQILQSFSGPIALASIDSVQINDRIFINVMSFGFDTLVAETSKKYRMFGKYSYQASMVHCLFGKKDFKFHLKLNDIEGQEGMPFEDTDYDLSMAAICNASYYGNGFCPGAEARLDDGKLDFCIAKPMGGAEILSLAPRYTAGKIKGHPKVSVFRLSGGIISSVNGENLPINCDGELFECKEAVFQVLPKSVRILLPEAICRSLELSDYQTLSESR